ncbi:hypothetical protein F4779DRAFT_263843 [Xylariaceae sp. FL0662B]|nr:hypothetical protein F4779DRAFT_263843 [Xylariaceae sp. FL0662B]
MAEPGFRNIRSSTFESLQNRSGNTRRLRPPDITTVGDENRVPLRPERLKKRDSKIGLKSIFIRSKAVKNDRAREESSSPRETPRSAGIRASLAEISNWPRLHSVRSEASLLSSSSTSSRLSPSPETPPATLRSRGSAPNGKSQAQASPKPRAPTVPWVAPPLFQMYPQAIKHAMLPACAVPVDTLVRLSESRKSLQRKGSSQTSLVLDPSEAYRMDRQAEVGKKLRVAASKFPPERATKIYALVTSGYLLQYAPEGPFDRRPEKILQLTKDSAAYASDLIPGRHWVVRVTSSADADGNPSTEAKSLRSKFVLRGDEKKQVSNMLLIFPSPDVMDDWLPILRREIESLGGKKKLSETGKPDICDDDPALKGRGSRRTFVVRDPKRFSRVVSRDFSWAQENTLMDSTDPELANPTPEPTLEPILDDGSTTASMASLDGQRLDSLRNSGSDKRFSVISSGQRTIVTSAGSSPACSPTRESFSSHDDNLAQANSSNLPCAPEARLRPNAAAISNRRQSMQTAIPSFDVNARPHSILSTPTANQENGHQCVPNFSISNAANKRYSEMNPPRCSAIEGPQTSDEDGAPKLSRRSPPKAIAISRPLSIVIDQPSPGSPSSMDPLALDGYESPIAARPNPTPTSAPQIGNSPEMPAPDGYISPRRRVLNRILDDVQRSNNSSTRKYYDMNKVRSSREDLLQSHHEADKPSATGSGQAKPENIGDVPEASPWSISAPNPHEQVRRLSASPAIRNSSYKRTTFLAEHPSAGSDHLPARAKQWGLSLIHESGLTPPATCSPKRSAPSLKTFQQASSKQLLTVDAQAKALSTRRSMPQLDAGPPPAPPPTCALPPIPRKNAANNRMSIQA